MMTFIYYRDEYKCYSNKTSVKTHRGIFHNLATGIFTYNNNPSSLHPLEKELVMTVRH